MKTALSVMTDDTTVHQPPYQTSSSAYRRRHSAEQRTYHSVSQPALVYHTKRVSMLLTEVAIIIKHATETDQIACYQRAETVYIIHIQNSFARLSPHNNRLLVKTDFILCGHSRFCTSCVETVAAMDSGCPICRSPIHMVLRVFTIQ